jgi:hypothetical protein
MSRGAQSERVAWIHAGIPNVGARTLFAQLRKHEIALARYGVLLPRSGRTAAGHQNLARELTRARSFDPRLGTLATLRQELAVSRADQAVLVAEELGAVPHSAALAALADTVRRGGFEPRAVLFVRPQAEMIELGYSALAATVVLEEDYRFGPLPRFDDFLSEIEAAGRFARASGDLRFDYADLADGLRAALGADGVLVRVAEDPADERAPLRSFAPLLPANAAAALARVVALEPPVGNVVSYADILHALRVDATGDDELIASLRLAGREPFRALATADLQRIESRFAAQNERLASRYGAPLESVSAERRAQARDAGDDGALARARRMLGHRVRETAPGAPPRYGAPYAVLHAPGYRSRRICFIHTGTHKTGTTALQRFLSTHERALLERGLHYPLHGRVDWGHHNLAWELYAPELFDRGRGSLDDLVHELRAVGAPRACLSSEEFEYLHAAPQQLARLADAVRGAGYEPRVVLFVRPQADYLESLYAQLTIMVAFYDRFSSGDAPPFDRYFDEVVQDGTLRGRFAETLFDYDRLADRFANVVGRQRLIVRPYRGGANGSILDEFLALTGTRAAGWDASELSRENARASFADVLHALRVDGTGLPELMEAVALAGRTPFQALDERDLARVAARFTPSNQRLARCYGAVIPAISPRRARKAEWAATSAEPGAGAYRYLCSFIRSGSAAPSAR